MYGVGVLNNLDIWEETLLDNATYQQAINFCENYNGQERLWVFDLNFKEPSIFYQNHYEIPTPFGEDEENDLLDY